MENRELVEPPEDDVETSSSFCGSCSPVQEPNTEDIAFTVIHEQEGEVEAELVEPTEDPEIGNIQIVKSITDELISDVVVYEFVKAICHDVRVIHEREV